MLDTHLENELPLVAQGKVRDLYEVDDRTLLFVATDRISAYDVIMANVIPGKGKLLTLLTIHWFKILSEMVPDLQTHFITTDIPATISKSKAEGWVDRSMQVRKLKVFAIEAIVRGYISGSAWKEYQAKGTVHGIPLREGLQESEKIPGGALYTPSTKAGPGEHDENIHPNEASKLIGPKFAQRIERLAIKLYNAAAKYAEERGIILADTKFEFGLDEMSDEVILVDEVLTPDSSRFWSADAYVVGKAQDSFDKQYLRDWLTAAGLQGQAGVEMPAAVVTETAQKYVEAYQRLSGKPWVP
ncbi:MAG: Bifunctional purine biosynthetic protein ade1 [Vezdaea aestivalis]|nr:MAG: Bifunctional purine biosynthetic protein ade1 [Vezdaea aestivalis]